jgi:lipoprotein NlpI
MRSLSTVLLPALASLGCGGAALLARGDVAMARSEPGLAAVLHNCETASLNPDVRIEACSEIIHANIVSHGILAAFYNDRGAAYAAKHDMDHAMQDFEKALELKPDFPEAQANRTRLLEQKATEASTSRP